MGLDMRIPIGLLFSIVGALLFLYGLLSDRAIYAKSLDINVNLWWGLALVLFGAIMLLMSRAAKKKGPTDSATTV